MANGIITALLEHKFDLSRMEFYDVNEQCLGPLTSIVHNNDPSEGYKDHVGVYVKYEGGPTDALKINYVVYAAKGPDREPVRILMGKGEGEGRTFATKDGNASKSWGSAKCLPGTLDGLRREGYVHQDTTLHAFAILSIPEDAFKDPKIKCPASYAQRPFTHHLYLQTETPTATNTPLCNRFEIISNDDRHFWVHKEILAFNSHTFKQMFDPEKPQNAQFDYLREGRMTFK